MPKTLIHHATILDDINFLVALQQYSCTPTGDPIVVLKTAFAAGVPTLYAFNQFSCLDIVALRAGITWKCGKKLKPIARQGIAPWAGAATDFLYRLGPAQLRLGLWYYFVAQEATHFLARWTSLLYSQQGCSLPPDGNCGVPAFLTPFGLLNPGQTVIMSALIGCSSNCGHCSGRSISVLPGCQVTIIPMVTWHPYPPGTAGAPITIAIVEADSGDVMAERTDTINQATGVGHGFVMGGNLHGGLTGTTIFNVRVTVGDGGMIQQGECSFQIQWSGYKSELLPAGCIPKSAHL